MQCLASIRTEYMVVKGREGAGEGGREGGRERARASILYSSILGTQQYYQALL